MDIETLFKKFEARKTIIGNYQGYGISWEDVEGIFDELKTEVVKIPQEVADWIEGYKVEEEKEKRYFVKLKATNQYLHVDNFSKASFLPLSISSFGTEVTKTMLDNLGLSEVFSSPLFEVEEIKTKS